MDQLDLPADDRAGERPSHVKFDSDAKLTKGSPPSDSKRAGNPDPAGVKVDDIHVSVENV